MVAAARAAEDAVAGAPAVEAWLGRLEGGRLVVNQWNGWNFNDGMFSSTWEKRKGLEVSFCVGGFEVVSFCWVGEKVVWFALILV